MRAEEYDDLTPDGGGELNQLLLDARCHHGGQEGVRGPPVYHTELLFRRAPENNALQNKSKLKQKKQILNLKSLQ